MSLLDTKLRDLGLHIAGSPLADVVDAFQKELAAGGLVVAPQIYLSTDWGVNEGSASISIPFYLARADLIDLHREKTGLIEGVGPLDTLRYLRHEMGHVIDYAYKLHKKDPVWTKRFGDGDSPYHEEYRPHPFSKSYVVHLPGWYAQKHPQEDWAETFGVWFTSDVDWGADYKGCAGALRKLRYCDKVLTEIKKRPLPKVKYDDSDDISTLDMTLAEYYAEDAGDKPKAPAVMRAALRAAFAPLAGDGTGTMNKLADLVEARKADLAAVVYRLTGHFNERTEPLLELLATVATEIDLHYPAKNQRQAAQTLTSFIATMAMNFTWSGKYQLLPTSPTPPGSRKIR